MFLRSHSSLLAASISVAAATTLVGSSLAATEAGGQSRPFVGISTTTLADLHKGTVADLHVIAGRHRTDQILQVLNRQSLVGACIGSFREPGKKDVAIAMLANDLSLVTYAALFEGEVSINTVATYEVQAPSAGKPLPVQPHVSCDPWTALERLSRDVSAAGGQSTLKQSGKLDSICVVPMSSDWEYQCFASRPGSKTLIGVGGWRNP